MFDPVPTASKGMEDCYAHTDLEWRLTRIPDEWAVRGVFMNMLDERAAEFSADVYRAYGDFFTTRRFSVVRLYPVKDYLTRLTKLAELAFGAPNIHRGIFEIQAAAFPAWRRSLPGRMTFAVLGDNFDAILRMTNRAMSGAINHGSCVISAEGPGVYRAAFRDQPNYIEHAMAGALTGVGRACGVEVQVETKLIDPFNGDVTIRVLQPKAPAASAQGGS